MIINQTLLETTENNIINKILLNSTLLLDQTDVEIQYDGVGTFINETFMYRM